MNKFQVGMEVENRASGRIFTVTAINGKDIVMKDAQGYEWHTTAQYIRPTDRWTKR